MRSSTLKPSNLVFASLALSGAVATTVTHAQPLGADQPNMLLDSSSAVPAPAAPAKPPYSLPFQLRPVTPGTVVRTDTSFAFYQDPVAQTSGSTVASTLLASYKVTDEIAPLVRLGMVSNSPESVDGAAGFLNPVLGVIYGIPLAPEFKLGMFMGVALPVGSGGGDSPDPANVASNAAGIRARSAMDNAMFAVNDVVFFPGVGLAYINHGFTVQGEATVLQLIRTRGENAENAMGAKINPDATRTNLTLGLHAGYFIIPMLSAGVELRHQRWLSTPRAIELDTTNTLRDTSTVAFGPRLHFKLGDKSFTRPGIALALGLDDPLKRWESRSVQLDIPVVF
jgi:hypothetical protein